MPAIDAVVIEYHVDLLDDYREFLVDLTNVFPFVAVSNTELQGVLVKGAREQWD